MAARIAWLLNLDSDAELGDPTGYRTKRRSALAASALRERIADLVAADDVVIDDESDALAAASVASARGLLVQAFCPTPSALARLARLGLAPPAAPPLSVLRTVNDRAFCAQLGHGLPGAAFVRDMAALELELQRASPTSYHVIKRAFSFAGREQRRVRDGVLDRSTRGFCARSFSRGEGVQVEPWVERLQDVSRHGYLTPNGAVLVGPARQQRCDAMGRFVSMSPDAAQLTAAQEQRLDDEVERTARALAAAGYFGPFGIDGFSYRQTDGSVAFNPRCEINARFTMGYPRSLLLAALRQSERPPTGDETKPL
jgi:hypothetical protein